MYKWARDLLLGIVILGSVVCLYNKFNEEFRVTKDNKNVAIADFNKDGKEDVALIRYCLAGPSGITITYRNITYFDGSHVSERDGAYYIPRFNFMKRSEVKENIGDSYNSIHAIDGNGDGNLDLCLEDSRNSASSASNRKVFFGDGRGNFRVPEDF